MPTKKFTVFLDKNDKIINTVQMLELDPSQDVSHNGHYIDNGGTGEPIYEEIMIPLSEVFS